MSWCLGKVQRTTERFPHRAHYITHCPSSSKSMIILFALVLWKPFWLSYQHRLIIIDTGCDVTQASLTWIIYRIYLSLGIETSAPTCSWIFTCSSARVWFEWDFIDHRVCVSTERGHRKPVNLCFNESRLSVSFLVKSLLRWETEGVQMSACMFEFKQHFAFYFHRPNLVCIYSLKTCWLVLWCDVTAVVTLLPLLVPLELHNGLSGFPIATAFNSSPQNEHQKLCSTPVDLGWNQCVSFLVPGYIERIINFHGIYLKLFYESKHFKTSQ